MAKFAELTTGDVLSETQFYKVVKKVGDEIELQNDNKVSVVYTKEYVEACVIAASQFSSEKKVTKTEAAAILLSSPGVAIEVNFNTKVDEKELFEEVMKEISGATIAGIEAAVKKGIKKGINGVARTMRGRHFGELNDLGRLNFIDMDVLKDDSKPYDNRIRNVDPRTINWMIIKNIKYTVK